MVIGLLITPVGPFKSEDTTFESPCIILFVGLTVAANILWLGVQNLMLYIMDSLTTVHYLLIDWSNTYSRNHALIRHFRLFQVIRTCTATLWEVWVSSVPSYCSWSGPRRQERNPTAMTALWNRTSPSTSRKAARAQVRFLSSTVNGRLSATIGTRQNVGG